jgi:hypothetical protein
MDSIKFVDYYMTRLYFNMEVFDSDERERYLNKLGANGRMNSIYARDASTLVKRINLLDEVFKENLTHVYILAHGSPIDPTKIYADGHINPTKGVIGMSELASALAPLVDIGVAWKSPLKFIFQVCFSADKIEFGSYFTFNPNTVFINKKNSLIDTFRKELNKTTVRNYLLKGYSGQASRLNPMDKFTSIGPANARKMFLDVLGKSSTSSTYEVPFGKNLEQLMYVDDSYADVARHFGADGEFLERYRIELVKISPDYCNLPDGQHLPESLTNIVLNTIRNRSTVETYKQEFLNSACCYEQVDAVIQAVTNCRLRYAMFNENNISHSFTMYRDGTFTEKISPSRKRLMQSNIKTFCSLRKYGMH